MRPHRRGLGSQHCCRARRRWRRSNAVGWLNHGVDHGTDLYPGPVPPTRLHSHHRQPLSTRTRFHGNGRHRACHTGVTGFGPSIAEGELDLVNTIEADYNAGGDVTWATDPLTITAYSQSAVIASLAEPILHELGIPSSDLRFVLLGDAAADPSTGATGMLDTWGDTPFGKDILDLLGWGNLIDATTPNDLYPTDVFTVTGDLFGHYPVAAAELWVLGFFEHGDYMGLTESEIQAAMNNTATTVVDGLTTYYTIPDPSDLIATLLQTQFNDFFG